MTEKECLEKIKKYNVISEYYRKKALKLEIEYFNEINKDNKFLKIIRKSAGKQ